LGLPSDRNFSHPAGYSQQGVTAMPGSETVARTARLWDAAEVCLMLFTGMLIAAFLLSA
jgi:hypothetical protein